VSRGVGLALAGAVALLLAGAAYSLWFGAGGSGPVPVDGQRVVIRLPPKTAKPPPAPAATETPPPPPAPAPPGGKIAETLVPAPDPALVEETPEGQLPVIGRDGRQPWEVYARPFDRADKRPRIAVLIAGLGLDESLTRAAIAKLPGSVTLGFNPYGRQLARDVEAARHEGHEVVLGVPMEPADFPHVDPGPEALLTSLDDEQNLARLRWTLGRASGYVGVHCIFGSRFTTARQQLQPVLSAMKARGLLFIDDHTTDQSAAGGLARALGLPWAVGDRILDAEPSRAGVDKALADLEELARRNGAALGIGAPYPVTLDRVAEWTAKLASKGLVLAPVSAVAGLQPAPAMASQ
jgi:uncharacterized protein